MEEWHPNAKTDLNCFVSLPLHPKKMCINDDTESEFDKQFYKKLFCLVTDQILVPRLCLSEHQKKAPKEQREMTPS